MLGVFMIALGASDQDPAEGAFGWVLGAAGVGVWLMLAAVAGRIAFNGGPRRRWLVALPALLSAAWSGLAVLMFGHAMDLVFQLSGIWATWSAPLVTLALLSLTTAGAVPIALMLLVGNVLLRLLRSRRSASPQPAAEAH
ncbi:hypothetical protein ACFXQA_00825 [Microbacterium sp. P07]|uniref:hypothetical protein n=1 Tax=Microbacterium sp. P07 TaxID=3366952 RepID=UPI003747327B